MIKFIANSFTFKGIFSNRNIKKRIVIIYFLILVFVTSFPLNIAIINNNGWEDLNTITLSWRQNNPSWLPNDLPNDCSISNLGMEITSNKTYYFETINDDIKSVLVINPLKELPNNLDEYQNSTIYTIDGIYSIKYNSEYEKINYQKAILLCKEKVIYFADNTNESISGDYSKVTKILNFSELKNMEQSMAVSTLLTLIDNCFSDYMIFFNILVNTGTQLLLNILFVLIISCIFLLVRIKYQKVTTYSNNINIVVSSMTIPAILSFIAGITAIIEFTSFTVVLFQLLAPLIAIGAIYKGSNVKDPVVKDL